MSFTGDFDIFVYQGENEEEAYAFPFPSPLYIFLIQLSFLKKKRLFFSWRKWKMAAKL